MFTWRSISGQSTARAISSRLGLAPAPRTVCAEATAARFGQQDLYEEADDPQASTGIRRIQRGQAVPGVRVIPDAEKTQDEYAGLDRLDRAELDDDETPSVQPG
jgi:hypothetical protein